MLLFQILNMHFSNPAKNKLSLPFTLGLINQSCSERKNQKMFNFFHKEVQMLKILEAVAEEHTIKIKMMNKNKNKLEESLTNNLKLL